MRGVPCSLAADCSETGVGVDERRFTWEITEGYGLDADSGRLLRQEERAASLRIYRAEPGDRLLLRNVGFEYAVALYEPGPDEKYIYTYEYAPEENWTRYRGGLTEEAWRQTETVFSETVYFRVMLRKRGGQQWEGSALQNGKTPREESALQNGKMPREESASQNGKTPREGSALQNGKTSREGSASRTGQQRAAWTAALDWVQKDAGGDGSPSAPFCRRNCGAYSLFAEEIAKTAETASAAARQGGRCFFLLSDSHYAVGGTWEDTVYCMDGVNRQLGAEGCIHLGDATDGLGSKAVNSEYVRGLKRDFEDMGLPLYYTVGNHDSNYFKNNPERMTREEIYALYLGGDAGKPQNSRADKAGGAQNASTGEAGEPQNGRTDKAGDPGNVGEAGTSEIGGAENEELWYNRDDEQLALRMIFLDSFDPAEKVRYGFPEKELDWLEQLLEDTPQSWHTVIFSHVPPVARLHYWSREIRGSARLTAILRRYQRRSGNRLMAFIHGHNHADQIDLQEGFPIVSIGCTKCEYFEDKKPEGAHTYYRKLHTVSQELWDVLVINTQKECLNFIRFGAGEDRTVYCGENFGRYIWGDRDGDRRREARIPMKKVITYGTFDLFHEGHYNLLKRAKALGDYLIVGVTTEHYDEQRGKINIVDPLLERIENVRKSGFADEIIIEDHEGQKIEDIQKYGADIFTLGSDWKGSFDYLKEYCEVVYLERTPDISSTMLRSAKFPIVRLGIVGTGRIAPRFLAEAKYVSGLNVQSAYNPHRESVRSFAGEHELEGYSGEFEEFLESVDAIYIATPHDTHAAYTRKAIRMGKHVLCEKPLTFTTREARELFALAREKGVVLMEGIKTAYCPGFAQLINVARSGKIGDIVDVEACFSRLTAPNLRERTDAEYGGAFLEFGSYTLLPIIKLLGLDYETVKFSSIHAENGVDLYTKVYFDYPRGMATSKTGVGVKSEGQLLISGTKGYILAESPWWLTRKFQVRYEDPNQIETYTPKFLGDGLRYEISEFVSRINGRNKHPDRLTEEESIAMTDVVERFMEERREQRRQLAEKNRSSGVRIWAHRGCSLRCPENTLQAFEAACRLPGLAGIELDIQLSADGELVVFHDETLDRIMGRHQELRSLTWAQLQELEPKIPSMRQVLELVKPYAQEKGIRINIELKNSRFRYEGMEEKILALVAEYGMESYVVYSSFSPQSLVQLKELDAGIETGILQSDIADCRRLVETTRAEALHPNVESVLREYAAAETARGVKAGGGAETAGGTENIGESENTGKTVTVRAWNGQEPFYGSDKPMVVFDLERLRKAGVTDFITNVPEQYLGTD